MDAVMQDVVTAFKAWAELQQGDDLCPLCDGDHSVLDHIVIDRHQPVVLLGPCCSVCLNELEDDGRCLKCEDGIPWVALSG